MLKKLLFFIFIFGSMQPIFSQRSIEKHQAVWGQLFLHLDLKNPKYYILTDIQERYFVAPAKSQQMFLVRPRVYRRLANNWDIGLGLAYFALQPSNPAAKVRITQPEVRPFLELANRQALGKGFNLSHRYVLENRIIRKIENGALVSGNTQINRIRYRLNMDIDLFEIKEKAVKLRLNDEILIQFGKNVKRNWFDHNRLGFGLVWPLSKSFSIETGYTNWYQELASGDDFYNRHIVRVGFSYKIKL
jgi:hypothetical protein